MNNEKKCASCGKIKKFDEFHIERNGKYGLRSKCKECRISENRTKNGLVTRIYGNQRLRSKRRGHPLPTYTREELKEWLYSQEKFHILYDNWKRLDFQSDYAPSVDRKDDYIGYAMANIQLMTWGENNEKGHRDAQNGRNTKKSRIVIQLSRDGEYIAEFHSGREASRRSSIGYQLIMRVCRGGRKTAGGFKWEFKGERVTEADFEK